MELIEKYLGEAKKTKNASKVLQLMDKDYSYVDAVKKVSKETGVSRKQLDKELDHWV